MAVECTPGCEGLFVVQDAVAGFLATATALSVEEKLVALGIHHVAAFNSVNAEKKPSEFRDYAGSVLRERVEKTYRRMHVEQTYGSVLHKRSHWHQFNHGEFSLMQVLEQLNNLVDESDPDIDLPNSVHAFQTAERIRAEHPTLDWFHLVGLLHDIGKFIALHNEDQHFVVGDTFPLGCAFDRAVVVHGDQFDDNPDSRDDRFNTKLGVYEESCGFDNVVMSYGHDEYMYQVLVHNGTSIPDEGLYMVRYHSFYPWHTAGGYRHLESERDRAMLPWVKEFNRFDLYSKSDDIPDVATIRPYYESLVQKYLPATMKW